MIRVEKNVVLPYEALNNFDLVDAVEKLKIKCFRGVYLLDTMPEKPNNRECGKMGEIKLILIVMAFNHQEKLLTIWEVGLIIILIKYNREGRYSVDICVYMC